MTGVDIFMRENDYVIYRNLLYFFNPKKKRNENKAHKICTQVGRIAENPMIIPKQMFLISSFPVGFLIAATARSA